MLSLNVLSPVSTFVPSISQKPINWADFSSMVIRESKSAALSSSGKEAFLYNGFSSDLSSQAEQRTIHKKQSIIIKKNLLILVIIFRYTKFIIVILAVKDIKYNPLTQRQD